MLGNIAITFGPYSLLYLLIFFVIMVVSLIFIVYKQFLPDKFGEKPTRLQNAIDRGLATVFILSVFGFASLCLIVSVGFRIKGE